MRFACWITEARVTHSERVTYRFSAAAVVSQKISILRYTYIVCLVTEMVCVYSSVRPGTLSITDYVSSSDLKQIV